MIFRKILFMVLVIGFVNCDNLVFAQIQDISTESKFDSNKLFPDWGEEKSDDLKESTTIGGVIGQNEDKTRIWQYFPKFVDIIFKYFSPVLVVYLIFVGVRLVYSAEEEEIQTKTKKTFMYALLGLLFMILSYSIMKVVYFLLS